MLLNVSALVVFAVNAWLHSGYWTNPARPDATVAIILAVIGIGITLMAGWLGWNLVQKHHVGVEPAADLERPELRRAA